MTALQRPFRTTYALSPATQKHLVETYATGPHDSASSSSESPDSLYSDHSPTFPDQAFEYDSYAGEVVAHDEQDYEGLMAARGVEGWESPDASPAWGQWPETNLGTRDQWSPSPKNAGTPRKGSIVSISPRDSLGSVAAGPGAFGSLSSRRGSAALQRLGSESRRGSDPSLLGFELGQRRRSSGPRGSPKRRRSSVMSGMSATGSSVDPAEENRLRHMASMGALDRRFSEVVEVTCPSDDDDVSEGDSQLSGLSGDDVSLARARISAWSPSTCSTYDDDVSEVHTAPNAPTPELLTREPLILSNFPLQSVAVDQSIDTPDLALSERSDASPLLAPPTVRPSSGNGGAMATPPPPEEPLNVLRARSRPGLSRVTTDYQFPPRSSGVPMGAAIPPPLLNRSVSAPFFSNNARSRAAAANLAKRAAGSFPVARIKPLGRSRLRESTRRGSVASEVGGESRRGSVVQSSAVLERRSSTGERRGSSASTELRRPSAASTSASAERRRSSLADPGIARGSISGSVVAQRRMSLVNEGPRRKSSVPSVHSHHSSSRKQSAADSAGRRTSGSIISRKSSVVSIGEYGYLAPSIVVDAPASPVPTPDGSRTPSVLALAAPTSGIQRRNAPALIQLPEYHFPQTAPNTPMGNMPRYNVLETFLGVNGEKSPSPGTPGTVVASDIEKTPKNKQETSIMNRGRPVASPEFRDSFPFRHTHAPVARVSSQKQQSRRDPHQHRQNGDRSESSSPARVVQRKAVPQVSPEQLRRANDEQLRANAEREHARVQVDALRRQHHSNLDQAILRASVATSSHRRQTSDDIARVSPDRPTSARRQATLPAEMDQSPLRMIDPERAAARATANSPSRPRPQLHQQPSRPELRKQPSVTFMDRRAHLAAAGAGESSPASPQRPAAPSRASSFSRFFHGHGKSKSISQPQQPQPQHAPALQHKGSRSILRPVSMDSHALAGPIDLSDVTSEGSSGHGHGHAHGALWRMIAGNSPKSPKSPRSPRDHEDGRLPMRSFVH